MSPKTVTIFGTSRASEQDEVWQLAYDTGKACAEAGLAIANGGYDGTMLAAAKGASEAGGLTIGVTCSAFGRKGPNEYVRQEISTSSLPERLARLIELGDAYVVLPGGTGTLLEFAEVWELANKGFLPAAKPIIIASGFWKPLVDMMVSEDPDCCRFLAFAASAGETVDLLKKRLL